MYEHNHTNTHALLGWTVISKPKIVQTRARGKNDKVRDKRQQNSVFFFSSVLCVNNREQSVVVSVKQLSYFITNGMEDYLWTENTIVSFICSFEIRIFRCIHSMTFTRLFGNWESNTEKKIVPFSRIIRRNGLQNFILFIAHSFSVFVVRSFGLAVIFFLFFFRVCVFICWFVCYDYYFIVTNCLMCTWYMIVGDWIACCFFFFLYSSHVLCVNDITNFHW